MKKLFYLLLFSFFTQQASAQSITIQDAMAQKKILYKLSGSFKNDDQEIFHDADGQYFGKCMTISVFNIYKDTLLLTIDNGLMLMCEDTTVQDMIVTKSIHIDLLPHESKRFRLYAMCTEIKDKMPQETTVYKIGTFADDKLRAITLMIENEYMQNVIGQGAVWAYTDDATESDLRRYGATQYTLDMTAELLTLSGTATPFTQVQDSLAQVSLVIPLSEDESNEGMLTPTITLDLYVFYGATGIFLILLSVTIYLVFKKRKQKEEDIVQ